MASQSSTVRLFVQQSNNKETRVLHMTAILRGETIGGRIVPLTEDQ